MKINLTYLQFLRSPRRLLALGIDTLCTVVSISLAFFLRFNFAVPEEYFSQIVISLTLLVPLRVSSFVFFGLYSGVSRYAGMDDLRRIITSITLGSLLFLSSIALIFQLQGFPRSVFLIDWFVSLVLLGATRFFYRILRGMLIIAKNVGVPRNALIIGAGDVGEMILRSISQENEIPYRVVGFLDDDPKKKGLHMHGVEVLGKTADLERTIKRKAVKDVIIAIQNISGKKIREISEECQTMKVSCKTVPSVSGVLKGLISISHIRPVKVEDLLKREAVQLDAEMIRHFIFGKRVMVTGAGGSIGSELCRQIMGFYPRQLILFERGENNLYKLGVELREQLHDTKVLVPVVGDILDEHTIDHVLEQYTPEIIFHTAAYKHVPIMEAHPLEAVKNNILGTWNMASKSCTWGVQKFVLISTDKAVKPASIMGATKRVAEMICRAFNQEGSARFITVRFGNVLESNGSVIPFFRRQIARGGPVTVTHPGITRYFMTIPEAAQLVIQAAAMGKGGEIYVLDMGDPIHILRMAKDLISLSGMVLDEDIQIKFTGLRPGEKMHEELIAEQEERRSTTHPKISEINGHPIAWVALKADIEKLADEINGKDSRVIIKMLKKLVPDYRPGGAKVLSDDSY